MSDGSGTIGQYWYDGDGKRVKKYVPATGETTVFVYDAAGKLVAEYSTIVASSQDAKVAYLTNDHLGSPRINTDLDGDVIARHDYHPFGEEIATSQRTTGLGYAPDTIRKQFTSYDRDRETDLDFAQARYHDYNLGRFRSPDPLMASAHRSNPQTFNRYSYVLNNPYNLTDPSGMVACPPDDPECYIDEDKTERSGPIRVENEKSSVPGCGGVPCEKESSPTAGLFVGPPRPIVAPGAPAPPTVGPGAPVPVTIPPPGSAPIAGRALLTRAALTPFIAVGILMHLLAPTVQAPAPLPAGQTTTTTTTQDRDRDPTQTIYRVFGGGSAMYGWSWTPVDPRTVPNPRDGLGLPPENSGEFLVRGLVRTSNIQAIRPAQPIGPNRGGLPEYIINPRNVIITMRMTLTPPY